jgi:uncharacterized protein (DUF952 family)
LHRNVTAWCKVIGQNRAEAEDGIESLVHFCCHAQQRTKANNIFSQVSEKMVLDLLHDLAGINHGGNI